MQQQSHHRIISCPAKWSNVDARFFGCGFLIVTRQNGLLRLLFPSPPCSSPSLNSPSTSASRSHADLHDSQVTSTSLVMRVSCPQKACQNTGVAMHLLGTALPRATFALRSHWNQCMTNTTFYSLCRCFICQKISLIFAVYVLFDSAHSNFLSCAWQGLRSRKRLQTW